MYGEVVSISVDVNESVILHMMLFRAGRSIVSLGWA